MVTTVSLSQSERNVRDEIVEIYLIFHRTQQDEKFCYIFVIVCACVGKCRCNVLLLFARLMLASLTAGPVKLFI